MGEGGLRRARKLWLGQDPDPRVLQERVRLVPQVADNGKLWRKEEARAVRPPRVKQHHVPGLGFGLEDSSHRTLVHLVG